MGGRVRGLGAYAGLLIAFSFSAASQEQSAKWFSVPPDETALVIFADTKQPTALYALDTRNDLLDKFSWEFGFPLVRQYRLSPGDYRIVVNDNPDTSIKAELKPGELNYLQISYPNIEPNEIAIFPSTYEPIKASVSSIVDELTFKGYESVVAPQHLEPKDRTLHFNTEPPFAIPKPGDPPPQQN